MTAELTRRQSEIFAFIKERTGAGMPPTVREIMAKFGMRSPNGAVCHLRSLERKGYIVRAGHSLSRGISVPGMVPGVGEELYVKRGDEFVRLAEAMNGQTAGGGEA